MDVSAGPSSQKTTLSGKLQAKSKERELAPNQSTKQNRERETERERERERNGKVGEDVKVVTCSGRPGWQWWVRV